MELKQLKPSSSVYTLHFFKTFSSHVSIPTRQKTTIRFSITASAGKALESVGNPAPSPVRPEKKIRMDENESLTLDGIRSSLIRQEDSIIFSLLERSQYCYNANSYDHHAFSTNGSTCSLVKFMMRETEKLHTQVGRYMSPDEHPFSPADLPEPVLPPLQYPQVLHTIAHTININKKIWDMYFIDLLPRLVKEGNDGNCGSTAICDTICLQDGPQLMDLLTCETVEEIIQERVKMKAKIYGQEVTVNEDRNEGTPAYKIKPSLVADLYGDWIMPLTKEVQVQYLLRRLD